MQTIVAEVVKCVKSHEQARNVETSHGINKGMYGIFSHIDDAISAAEIAYTKLRTLSLEKRKEIIEAMRKTAIDYAQPLAELAVTETGLGKIDHKIKKNLLSAKKTPGIEDLTSQTWTGDVGLTLVEMAPYGVIGSITPCTNPAATVINNSLSMVSAGNTVVYNPHPSAKKVSNKTIEILNKAVIEAGGPENVLCSIENPTLESSQALMSHRGIKLLCVTGGGAVVKAAMTSGKKTIAAGPGNPPVIVDDTANLRKAAKYIVQGASFDNNVLCIAEKEVFSFENITDELKKNMTIFGAYEIKNNDIDRLVNLVFTDINPSHPVVNKDYVGKDAHLILQELGINVSSEICLIIAEVDAHHPFVEAEMLMPVLPIVRVKDLDEALDRAIEAEHGFKHTAIMHSENVVNMSKVARFIGTTIFVKNAPSYAGLGFGGEGYTTYTIAGPTGEGLTSARTFTRQRRCVLKDSFRII